MAYANDQSDVTAWVDEQRRRAAQDFKLCKCGARLPAGVFDRAGIWAASVEDAARFSRRQPTEHDIIGGHGKRLRVGGCTGAG